MKVRFTARALKDLDGIFAFIARNNPDAAGSLVGRIEAAAEVLASHPYIGRLDRRRNVRVLPVARTSYLLTYRASREKRQVQILRVFHGAQRRTT